MAFAERLCSTKYSCLFQNQNRRNVGHPHRSYSINAGSDHKAVGTPITGVNRNRNILERSISEPEMSRSERNANAQIMQQQQRQTQNGNINSSRYKTELCRPFEENGFCKYGDKCQFAHGHHELRSLARHPKYKTEPCRTFHTVGFCPYGPRCHFIHNEDERKLSQIDHLKQPQDMQQQQPQHHHHHHHQSQHQPSHPQQVPHGRSPPPQRPVRFTLPLVCDPLGSTADSPPSSVTDSPTLSPTFINDSDTLSSSLSSSSFSPPISAPPATFRAFTFQDLPGQGSTFMSPLNIHTDQIASLSAGIQAALTLNQRNNFANNLHHHHGHTTVTAFGSPVDHDMYAPPSPPDSICGDSSSSLSGSSMCGSPLELSRGVRLPIFAALSMDWTDRNQGRATLLKNHPRQLKEKPFVLTAFSQQ